MARTPPSVSGSSAIILGILRRHRENGLSGIDISHEAARLSKNRVRLPYATLYPSLRELEAEGLIEGSDEAPEERSDRPGRPKRFWRLTHRGAKALARAVKNLDALVAILAGA